MTTEFYVSSISVEEVKNHHLRLAQRLEAEAPTVDAISFERREPWASSAWYEIKISFERCGLNAWWLNYCFTNNLKNKGFNLKDVVLSVSPLTLDAYPYLLIRGRDPTQLASMAVATVGMLPSIGSRHRP